MADLIGEQLQNAGYTVNAVNSGRQCMDFLEKTSPDIILLDIMMEPMDGWQVLEEIRAQKRMEMIPVVMLTAKALTPREAVRRSAQIEDYIIKPVRYETLEVTFKRVFSRKLYLDDIYQSVIKSGMKEEQAENYRKNVRDYLVLVRMREVLLEMYHDFMMTSFSDDLIPLNRAITQQALKIRAIEGESGIISGIELTHEN